MGEQQIWDPKRDWIIQRSHHYQLALVVVFESEQPSVDELARARKLRPEFSTEPPTAFRRRVQSGRLDLGVLSRVEGREVASLASSLGLTLEPKAIAQTVYLFQDRTTGAYLIVEDPHHAEQVASEMLAAGVPMVSVEVD